MNLPSIADYTPRPEAHYIPSHYRSAADRAQRSPMRSYPQPQHGGFTSHPPPVPPPSPPVEESAKCSLPSISTLLTFADGGNTDRQMYSPLPLTQKPAPRVALPPTPPMRPDSVFDSPMSSTTSSPQYYYSQTNPKRQSYPPAGPASYNPPTEHYLPTYYSPQQQHTPSPYERPIPHQTAPIMVPVSVAPPSASNPWQHHHHSSPNSQAAFPQSQDRYICPTCSKAFSRPSSLRIHSHSHTGEKPFKCPHHGCGKAFSVRSNMKRHERGCHQ